MERGTDGVLLLPRFSSPCGDYLCLRIIVPFGFYLFLFLTRLPLISSQAIDVPEKSDIIVEHETNERSVASYA